MKYITGALVLMALLGSAEQVSAIKINSKAQFTDDLVKSLAEEMQKDMDKEEEPAPQAQPAAKPAAMPQKSNAPAKNASHAAQNATHGALAQKKAAPAKKAPAQSAAQTKKKHEEEEIPMDAAAIKAYSSVIADAAEDSEPSVPVQYSQVVSEEEAGSSRHEHEILGSDPIGSMVQNEITSIKMASIKAAEDN